MASNNSLDYGKRLIPQILDRLEALEPDRIVYSLTTLAQNSPKFQHISARVFANAVNRTAWWLQKQVPTVNGSSNGDQNLDPNKQEQEAPIIRPLGYIGPRKYRISEGEKSY